MRHFLPLAAALVVATTSMLVGLVALALSDAQPTDRPGPEMQAVVTTTTRKVERDLHPDEDPLPFPAPMIGSPPGLQADSLRLTPAVRGRTVALTARARVYDPVPGNLIAWRLQLHAGTGRNLQLLQDLDYADHAVTLPEGETVIMPTFQDSLELAPGRYTVTLWMYVVPPGFPRGLSTDELDRRAIATLSTRHQIVVVEE